MIVPISRPDLFVSALPNISNENINDKILNNFLTLGPIINVDEMFKFAKIFNFFNTKESMIKSRTLLNQNVVMKSHHSSASSSSSSHRSLSFSDSLPHFSSSRSKFSLFGDVKSSASSSSSSSSSSSLSHREEETLADWLLKGEFSLSLAPGFLGSYAQIGALKAIAEIVDLSPGDRVFAICGTSAGALTGGFIAKGMTLAEMEKEMFALTRTDIWDPALPTRTTPSLLQGAKMRSTIAEKLSENSETPTFKDCLCPFSVSTWSLGQFDKHVVSEGCLSSAIAASAAVPFLFAPVRSLDQRLVDGAVADPTGLGGCTAIPSSGRILHIGFPGELPGWRGVGSPHLLDSRLVPRSGAIDMVSVVLEKSPNVNLFKMTEEGPKASLIGFESVKSVLQQPMGPVTVTEAGKDRCKSTLRIVRAIPPSAEPKGGGIVDWVRKRTWGLLQPPTTENQQTLLTQQEPSDEDEVYENKHKKIRM